MKNLKSPPDMPSPFYSRGRARKPSDNGGCHRQQKLSHPSLQIADIMVDYGKLTYRNPHIAANIKKRNPTCQTSQEKSLS